MTIFGLDGSSFSRREPLRGLSPRIGSRHPGGSDLLRGTNVILGVNSYVTNVNCSGVGYSSRVDIPEVLAWINSFME